MFNPFECRHQMPTGRKCHAPAMRHSAYCFHHDRLHRYPLRPRIPQRLETLPVNTRQEIQTAITQVCNAMLSRQIEARRGGRLLYGLQVAVNALDAEDKAKHRAAKAKPENAKPRRPASKARTQDNPLSRAETRDLQLPLGT